MKLRTGFVSNSSTSSFVCEICEDSCSGYDINPIDYGFIECSKSHIFCKNCVGKAEFYRLVKLFNENYTLFDKDCPICNMKLIRNNDILTYLVNKLDIDLNITKHEMKTKFNGKTSNIQYPIKVIEKPKTDRINLR